MSPTGRTAVALGAVGLAALVLPAGLVLVALLGVLAVVAVDAWFARRPTTVERTLPEIAARGLAVPVRVAAAAAGAGSVVVRQPFPPDLDLAPDEAEGGLDAVLVPRRRGRHVVPPAVTRLTGPLGLARWDRAVGEEHEVRAYPDLPAARRLAAAVRAGRFDAGGRRRRGPLGLGTEFDLVRDHQPDDDVRQINWRATERTGRPMSNQYRLEQERDVVLLVDSGRLMAAPLDDRTRLDVALDAAVAVAAVAEVLGDRVGVVAFAGSVRRRVSPRRGGSRRVVEAVYDLEPLPEESDPALAVQLVAGAKRSVVVVLTDLLDEAAARSLLDAVPVLVRRHAVVVASIADPEIAGHLRTPPATTVDACAQAVALDLVEARRATVARLRRTGAEVVDVPPDRLSAACVRAYLRQKSRGIA